MSVEEKRLLFKTLLYLVGTASPNAGYVELINDLRFQVNKCGKVNCGNGGEHTHLTQQEGKE